MVARGSRAGEVLHQQVVELDREASRRKLERACGGQAHPPGGERVGVVYRGDLLAVDRERQGERATLVPGAVGPDPVRREATGDRGFGDAPFGPGQILGELLPCGELLDRPTAGRADREVVGTAAPGSSAHARRVALGLALPENRRVDRDAYGLRADRCATARRDRE